MIYKTILPLLIGILLLTTINGQDTLKVEKSDSTINKYEDSIKVKKDCGDIRTEQREINDEMKRQLNVLKEFLNRGEEDPE